jgi:glycosylphosphatidylinositol transamidase (GPIT) subunit GPI8
VEAFKHLNLQLKTPQKGVPIDYKGEDVSPTNFMAVLLGNETATNGKPVLKSTKNDKVFVYYTDHGGSGIVVFPSRSNSLVRVKFNPITQFLDASF